MQQTLARAGQFTAGSSHLAANALRRHAYRAVSVVSAIAFLTAWDLMARVGLIDPAFLPPPTQVIGELTRLLADGTLLDDIAASTVRVLVGFAFAAAVGVPLG